MDTFEHLYERAKEQLWEDGLLMGDSGTEPCLCAACGEAITDVQWRATFVRSNVSEDGIVGGAIFDTLVSVPPGTYTAHPCGHRIDPERGQSLMQRFAEGGRMGKLDRNQKLVKERTEAAIKALMTEVEAAAQGYPGWLKGREG